MNSCSLLKRLALGFPRKALCEEAWRKVGKDIINQGIPGHPDEEDDAPENVASYWSVVKQDLIMHRSLHRSHA